MTFLENTSNFFIFFVFFIVILNIGNIENVYCLEIKKLFEVNAFFEDMVYINGYSIIYNKNGAFYLDSKMNIKMFDFYKKITHNYNTDQIELLRIIQDKNYVLLIIFDKEKNNYLNIVSKLNYKTLEFESNFTIITYEFMDIFKIEFSHSNVIKKIIFDNEIEIKTTENYNFYTKFNDIKKNEDVINLYKVKVKDKKKNQFEFFKTKTYFSNENKNIIISKSSRTKSDNSKEILILEKNNNGHYYINIYDIVNQKVIFKKQLGDKKNKDCQIIDAIFNNEGIIYKTNFYIYSKNCNFDDDDNNNNNNNNNNNKKNKKKNNNKITRYYKSIYNNSFNYEKEELNILINTNERMFNFVVGDKRNMIMIKDKKKEMTEFWEIF